MSGRPMVYDCFLLMDELELLELRLHELDAVVDRFVIVEAPLTFRGEPKPLHFQANAGRFERWRDRIDYVVPNDLPGGPDPWRREHASRGWIVKALSKADDGDTVLVSDVDEIPRADSVHRYHPSMGALNLQMRIYRYYLNYLDVREWAYFAKISSVGAMRKADDGESGVRYHPDHLSENRCRVAADAGWHFTSMGGTDRYVYKMRHFSHYYEPGPARMTEWLKAGKSPLILDEFKLRKVDIDDTYPAYVCEREAELRATGWIAP